MGIKGGAALATQEVGNLCSAHLFRKQETRGKKGKDRNRERRSTHALLRTLEQRRYEGWLEKVLGAILKALADTTHVLTAGYDAQVVTLKTSGLLFARIDRGDNVVVYPKQARIGGHVSKKTLKNTAGKPYLLLERSGRGRVVLFVDDPNFRLFWRGLTWLFLNALFFSRVV